MKLSLRDNQKIRWRSYGEVAMQWVPYCESSLLFKTGSGMMMAFGRSEGLPGELIGSLTYIVAFVCAVHESDPWLFQGSLLRLSNK
jgi:hypothetical protein